MSIGSINTVSNNSNLHELELICNKISFSDPFQINKSLPEEVSSAEEGEIFDDVSFTGEKVSDCISYTNEGLNDSEISVIQDTLNTMWNSSGASSREQDKVGQPTAEILTSDEFDKIGDENIVTPQHRNNTKNKVFISNYTDIFKSQIRSNNDQDKNEISINCTDSSRNFSSVDTTDRKKATTNLLEDKSTQKKMAVRVKTNQPIETISKRKSRENSKEKTINPENIDSRIKEKIEKRIKERCRTKDTTPSHTSSREARVSRYRRSRSNSFRSMSKENDKTRSKNKSPTGKKREKCGHRSNSTENRRIGYEDDDNYDTNFSNEHRRRSKSHIHPAEVLLTNCKRSQDSYEYALSRHRYSSRRSTTPPRGRKNDLKCTPPSRFSNYRSNKRRY